MKKFLQLLLAVMMITCAAFAIACEQDPETCKHDYVETVVAATCTEAGVKNYECSKCHDKYSEAGDPALGHEFKEENYTEKTAATCVSAQVLSCKCTRCDQINEKNGTAALGHNVVYTTVTEPTCTTDGVKNGKCSRCDYEEKDVAIKSLGHNYELSAELSVAPTCTEEGKDVEVCSRCTAKIETVIPSNGHTDDGTKEDIVAPTCTDKGTTTRHCSKCGNDYIASYEDALGHDWSEVTEVTATCLTAGYKTKTCKRSGCGEVETWDKVPKLDHEFDESGKCTQGCNKTVNDKITWVNTEYTVTENTTDNRLTFVGEDPGKEQTQHDVTIPAEVLKAKKDAGFNQFVIKMFKNLDGTKPQFGYKLASVDGGQYVYREDALVTDAIKITDEMLESGFACTLLFCDLNQRKSVEEAPHVIGFDLDIEFSTKQEFDINNKDLWLTSQYEIKYDADASKWVVTGGDPGTGVKQAAITIDAKVISAMKTSGMEYFVIKIARQYNDQYMVVGYKTTGEMGYTDNSFNSGKIAITDEMLEKGFTFTALYNDQNQINGKTATHVTGFDLTITFDKEVVFDINNKDLWLTSQYEIEYNADASKWVVTGGDPGTGVKQAAITIDAKVISAMKTSGMEYFVIKIARQYNDQYMVVGYKTTGEMGYTDNSFNSGKIAITDEMLEKGFTFTALYNDQNQINGKTATHVTGFDLTITFDKEVVFDIDNKSTWLDTNFDECNYVEGTKWGLVGSQGGQLIIKADVIAAMADDEGYTQVTVALGRLNSNECTGFTVTGYDGLPSFGWSFTYTFTITDEMKENGIILNVSLSDGNWGNEWVSPTGCSLVLTFA